MCVMNIRRIIVNNKQNPLKLLPQCDNWKFKNVGITGLTESFGMKFLLNQILWVTVKMIWYLKLVHFYICIFSYSGLNTKLRVDNNRCVGKSCCFHLQCTRRQYFFFFRNQADHRKGKGKVVHVHAMKAYRKSGGVAPRILNLGVIWGWVIKITLRPLCFQERIFVPHSLSGNFGDGRNLLHL